MLSTIFCILAHFISNENLLKYFKTRQLFLIVTDACKTSELSLVCSAVECCGGAEVMPGQQEPLWRLPRPLLLLPGSSRSPFTATCTQNAPESSLPFSLFPPLSLSHLSYLPASFPSPPPLLPSVPPSLPPRGLPSSLVPPQPVVHPPQICIKFE